MTKKDYIKVAEVLHYFLYETNNSNETELISNLALSLGKVFKDDNPRFDTVRFIKAVTG